MSTKAKYKKVFKVTSEDFRSAMDRIGFPVQYKRREYVTPTLRKSKLFVFDSLKAAKLFADAGQVIWEARGKNPVKLKWRCSVHSTPDKIQLFWENQVRCYDHDVTHALKGSLGCDAVKLVRIIRRVK